MKQITFWSVIFVLIFTSCEKDVKLSDIFDSMTLSKKTIDADGSTAVTVTVVLNKKASADRRKVILTSTGGTLVGAENGKLVITADYANGMLVATGTLKAPMRPGKIVITATPELSSPSDDYKLKDSLEALLVAPVAINIEPSSFGIGANFTTTDTLIGTLTGPTGQKVSSGVAVEILDFLKSTHEPAKGAFRQENKSSDNNSQVSALYSAYNHPVGTEMYVRFTVLDDQGNPTNIKDSVFLTINQ